MFIFFSFSTYALHENTTVYFFWGEGCPHCEEAKPFLKNLEENNDLLNIKYLEVYNNETNLKKYLEFVNVFNVDKRAIPAFFIGDFQPIFGYSQNIADNIEEKINYCLENYCPDPINNIKKTLDLDTCIHVFLNNECDECQVTKNFINSLDVGNISIKYHNIEDIKSKELYETFKNLYGLKVGGFPILFFRDSYLIGVDAIQNNFNKIIEECQEQCPCPASQIKGNTPSIPKKDDYKVESMQTIDLPFVGNVKIGEMSLVLMTLLISFIDGFNPCSLWVLTFLLGIVIYSGSRKKIFLVGLTFLIVTATAYGAFMLGLLNVFSYIGYTLLIRIIVSTIALLFAVVNIKDYFWYKKGISFTISDKYKPKLFKKVRNVMNPHNSIFAMIITTMVMALGIVLVELPCTAGFPMIWTSIIAQNNVTGINFAILFALYLLIYLLIEIIVFFSAVLTLKKSNFGKDDGRKLKLIGGIVMFAIAIALLFFPDLMNTLNGSLYLFGSAGIISALVIFIYERRSKKNDK